MAFDPDAYLAKKLAKPSAGFDPDAYLASKGVAAAPPGQQPGVLEALLRGGAQGATLNFADELTAGAESVLGSIGLVPDKTYDQALAESRANYHAAEEAHPIASGLGSVGGGLATAFVPGLGAAKLAQGAGFGSKLLQAGKLGAKLGAAGALGATEDSITDDFSGALTTAVKGGAMGAATGVAAQTVASGLGAAGRAVFGKIRDALSPNTQLALAVGATPRELNRANDQLYKPLMRAIKTVEDEGLFHATEGEALNTHELLRRVQANLDNKGEAIGRHVASYGDRATPDTSFRALYNDVANAMGSIIEASPPPIRGSVTADLQQSLDELLGTGGKLADIWRLKSSSGAWAGKAWDQALPPPVKDGYMSLNQALNRFLTDETGALANTLGSEHGKMLAALNQSYHASSTLEPLLGKAAAKLDAAPSSLGFSGRDLGAGGLLYGAATSLGAGPLATPIGIAGAAANQYVRSVPGRIARAQLGRKLENTVQKMSELSGAIPRNVQGAQEWLKQHMPMIPPQMQQTAAAIVGAPPDRAEKMIRAVMPEFSQYFAKSKYPSELDGKVSDMGDKMAIRRELEKLQLPSSQMALHLSALYRDGTISPLVYNPEDYASELDAFVERQMRGQ
jgi:hypothetical protein